MNVAIFTDNDFDKVNGVTTVLRAVLEHHPRDVRVRIYTCDPRGSDRPDYFSLPAFGVGIPYYREMKVYAPPFRRFLRQAQADDIGLVHVTTPGPVGLAGLWVAAKLGVPLIGSFHTHLAEYARRLSGSDRLGALMRVYLRWLYGRCEQVLAPSEATRQVLVQERIQPSRLRIWERGVCTERFSPEKRSAAIRAAWGASDDRPVLLYVGRLSKEKGLGDMPAVQRALSMASIAHQLVFIGDGPLRAELESRCPGAIFTGSLEHHQVADAMASSDVFVFPSRTDTAGNVVLEAQASGLPVLVTNEGGPQENIRPGASGEVCATVEDLVRHAGELLSNPARRAAYAGRARAFALERRWDLSLMPLFRSYRELSSPVHTVPVAALPASTP
jgi:glycosyltransferase involved in cell wall biosynthesis